MFDSQKISESQINIVGESKIKKKTNRILEKVMLPNEYVCNKGNKIELFSTLL